MKGVILVGGLGTRLRPLTCNVPKPLIPLANRPFLEHMLVRLREQGITEVILAVQYLAEQFRAVLGDGSQLGITLTIVEEPEPRGTAGAVKHVEHLLDGTTFVFNGDVVTDLDLPQMLAFHRAQQSHTTIALTPVDDPTQFGLVEMEADRSVRRFLEKPRAEDITSNLINAGTYIIEPDVLSYIPPNEFYMFERGLFPVLLQRREPMFGFPARAYWNDIGRPHNYLEVNHDILIGKVQNVTLEGEEIAERVIASSTPDIAEGVQIVGPVVMGHNVTIERGAHIIGPTVIGNGCTIGAEATVEGSVLWQHNTVLAGATIRGSVVGNNNTIASGTVVTGGSIISDDCAIGADNRLDKGVRFWPGTVLQDSAISF